MKQNRQNIFFYYKSLIFVKILLKRGMDREDFIVDISEFRMEYNIFKGENIVKK